MDLTQKILSDITVFNKYAKYLPEELRRETWEELCDRNMQMHIRKFPNLKGEIEAVCTDFVIPKKVFPSMRSLQFGGRPIELNAARQYNCSFLPMDSIEAFSETLFLLLSGTGVGYSVQSRHIKNLPTVIGPLNKPRRYVCGDSIEGWSDSLKVLMKAYLKGKCNPVFDFSDIRPKGARLVTSGGKAPGPDPLKVCLEKVREILDGAVGRQLRSIEVHDLACHVADAVLSGGIRRAAMIALFSPEDESMLTCKGQVDIDNWEFEHRDSSYHGFVIYKGKRHDTVLSEPDYASLTTMGKLPWYFFEPQRGRANNSAVLHREFTSEREFKEIWKKTELSQAGEPGFFWTNDFDVGTNPCCLTGDTNIDVLNEAGITYTSRLDDAIEAVNSGTNLEVCSYSTLTKKREYKKIIVGRLMRKDAPLVRVSTEDSYLFCTEDHRIFTNEDGYVKAIDLQNNTGIEYGENRAELAVQRVNHWADVYDIEVKDNNNFFANGILVHNCEISLNAYQVCNLSTINASTVENQEDLNARARAASFLGTLQAAYTDFHYLRPIWRETTEREALIGVSMSGIASGKILPLDLKAATEEVKTENERVAKLLGINPAARCTALKPEGTSSLVMGASSGIHAWHNDYYIRRMRVGKNEALYGYMKSKVPELVEDCAFKPTIEAVMSFPQKAPDGAILRTENYMDLLERVKRFNTEWVHTGHRTGKNYHNVSVTVSLKDDEWEGCGNWMWENRDTYTGVSVLPYDSGTYIQAPFEDITEDKFNELLKHLTEIDLTEVFEYDDTTDLSGEIACGGGACEVK